MKLLQIIFENFESLKKFWINCLCFDNYNKYCFICLIEFIIFLINCEQGQKNILIYCCPWFFSRLSLISENVIPWHLFEMINMSLSRCFWSAKIWIIFLVISLILVGFFDISPQWYFLCYFKLFSDLNILLHSSHL